MFRKVSLLILTGALCLIAGIFDRRVVADDCPNTEPDETIYCPVKVGDDPSLACGIWNNKTACEMARHASFPQVNRYVTKYSKGNFSEIVLSGSFPYPPLTTECYLREYCEWDGTNGKCVIGKTEQVWQNIYKKASCPPTEH